VDQQQLDMSGLNLVDKKSDMDDVAEEPPKMSIAREKILEEAKRALDAEGSHTKKGISIVVIGRFIAIYSPSKI
ncbi:hypothetical protein CPC08DRAFT_623617, partial [Agrocybe pediades]